jgi:Ca2+-binding RTX toxin-like protein
MITGWQHNTSVQRDGVLMAGFAFLPAKWGSSAHGTPAGQITWSFAAVAGAFHSFEGQLTGIYQSLVRAAFDRWESLADINFVEVSDSSAVDIRMGWDSFDGRGGTLGEARFTYQSGVMTRAEIAFDKAETWVTDPQASSGTSFFAVALHEIGHALGLAHTDDPETLMYPYLGQQRELDNLDAEGITLLYGRSGHTFGSSNADGFNGSFGADIFSGGEGADTISGGNGDDLLYGNQGDDVVSGNEGQDLIYGGQGYDLLYDGQENDFVFGNMADDRIFGNMGDDFLHGGQNNDYLHGGQGNDTLNGGVGDDTMNGGLGADRLVFAPGGGHDRIEGFSFADGDRLELSGQSYTRGFSDRNTVLTLGDGSTITLIGTGADSSLF